MDPNDISELADLFRSNGDAVLDGEIKFSVSGQMLRALNDSFSLIVKEGSATPPGETSRDFIVTTATDARSPVFLDLQLIYDFVQVLTHLHINQLVTDDQVEQAVDLINFRSLQKLDIQKLPVHKLTSLRRLRSQLRELSCQQCLKQCQDVLRLCGGDRSAEQVWTELRVINFSYNALDQIDDSVRWTPWVHTLNLSHNCLTSASLVPLQCLPNLKSLDLSFNKLETIPELCTDASRKLQTLKLHSNSIRGIAEVVEFEALAELDLASNYLLHDDSLTPLGALASLRFLNLLRNPLAFTPRHRQTAIKCLHSNTSTVKFILNGVPMTKAEKRHTGGMPSYYNARRPCRTVATSTSPSPLTTSITSLKGESTDSKRLTTESAKKKSRVREILLPDAVDDDGPVVGSPRRSLSARRKGPVVQSEDHLETKKQIEELRDKFGSNWLNADGENIVKDVFPVVIGESEEEDSFVRRQTMIDDLQHEDSVLSSTPKEGMASRLEITDEHLDSTAENYGTASERTAATDGGTTIAAYESALSKELSSDFFQSQQSVEDEVAEPNEVEYFVEKLRTAKDESGWKLLLVVSDLSIKEKDPMSNEVINRWGLTVLESCERPSNRSVISIQFNTMRSDKKQRFYLMADEVACLRLSECLRDILANRDLSEFNQAVYKCANCTTQFCIDKYNQRALEKLKCPECKSSLVIEITETNNNSSSKLKNPTVQKVRSLEHEEKVPMVKSHSHSSIGSAASLNESSSCSKISNPPASSIDSNESVAGSSTSQRDKDADLSSRRLGMDSDVEILSNPSQSSIEVLNSCSKNSSRKHSSEERRNFRLAAPSDQTQTTNSTATTHLEVDQGDAAELVLDTTNVAVANKLLGNCQLQALTESSSSGSITESICTQYEPAAAVEEHKAVAVEEEQLPLAVGFKKSSSTFLEGFLSASNMLKNLGQVSSKAADGIRLKRAEPFLFSTTNFQRADHRLQLYLMQNVFLEANEKFLSVLRGGLVGEQAVARVEDSLVVLSNKMLYLFLVTAGTEEEQEDDPGQWLRLMRRVEVKEWECVRVLPFAMGLRFCFSGGAAGSWNVLLQDGQHTGNYVGSVVRGAMEKRCEEAMCEEQRRKLMEALVPMRDAEEEEEGEELLIVAPFKGLTKIVNENAQGVERGRCALVVTNKRFAVLSGNWTWLLEEREKERPEVLFQLSLTDMVECEVRTDTEFVLNFMDEQENRHELWCLEFESRYAAQKVLEAIQGPWEKVFDAPLVQK